MSTKNTPLFSLQLKKKAEPLLKKQFKHPFVQGLSEGTLALDKFKYYMIQDSLYIVEYARAMAWVAPLLTSVGDIMAMLDAAKESFKIEAMLKEQYFQKFGITMEEALKSRPSPACQAYVDHLFRFTRTGTLAEGMAAILPCGWVYIEIGQKFTSGRTIPEEHPYKPWLMTYAVPEFKEMVDWWFQLLDTAVEGFSESALAHIEDIFMKSCHYEWMFWEMSWQKQSWND